MFFFCVCVGGGGGGVILFEIHILNDKTSDEIAKVKLYRCLYGWTFFYKIEFSTIVVSNVSFDSHITIFLIVSQLKSIKVHATQQV